MMSQLRSFSTALLAASYIACAQPEPAEPPASESGDTIDLDDTLSNALDNSSDSGTDSDGEDVSGSSEDVGEDVGEGEDEDVDDTLSIRPDMMAGGCMHDEPEAGLYCVGARPFHVAVENLDGQDGPEIVVSSVGSEDIHVFHAGAARLEPTRYSPLRASVSHSDLHHVVLLPTSDPSELRIAVFLFRQVPDRSARRDHPIDYSRYEILDAANDFSKPRLLQDWTRDGLWYLAPAPWSRQPSNFISISLHGELVQWQDQGEAGFVRGDAIPSPSFTASAVRSADLTSDGVDDLAVFTHALLDEEPGTSGIVVFPSEGEQAGAAIVSAWPMASAGPGQLADMTGDGYLDAVAIDLNELVVVPGLGDGYFDVDARQELEFDGSSQGFRGPELTLGDFNRDGRSDVALIRCADGVVQIYLSETTGMPTLSQTLEVGFCTHIASGDLLGNGEIDLVVTLGDRDQLQIIRGEGDGTFSLL